MPAGVRVVEEIFNSLFLTRFVIYPKLKIVWLADFGAQFCFFIRDFTDDFCHWADGLRRIERQV